MDGESIILNKFTTAERCSANNVCNILYIAILKDAVQITLDDNRVALRFSLRET